jgi:hypothetical protein
MRKYRLIAACLHLKIIGVQSDKMHVLWYERDPLNGVLATWGP